MMIIIFRYLLAFILLLGFFRFLKMCYDEHKVCMREMNLKIRLYDWILTTEGYYDEEI